MDKNQLIVNDTAALSGKSLQILESCNPEQQEAILHNHTACGPLLVLAGAGTGKTTVLTRRLAYLYVNGVRAENLLALTFTRAAASEMKERALLLCQKFSVENSNPLNMTVSTFHALSLGIARDVVCGESNLKRAGFSSSSVRLIEEKETNEIIMSLRKTIIDSMQRENLPIPRFNETLDMLERLRNHFDSPETIEFEKWGIGQWKDYYSALWNSFTALKREKGLLDFNDMTSTANSILEKSPEVLEHYKKKYTYILVDEYQDTNMPQYHLLKLLAGQNPNLFIVGDDDQSIYRFRGADIRNILSFTTDFPGARIIKLTTNYRSTQKILTLANNIFKDKKAELKKVLRPFETNKHPSFIANKGIKICRFPNDQEEAQFVLSEIKRIISTLGFGFHDIAILFRLNHQEEQWKTALTQNNIPIQSDNIPNAVTLSTIHGAKGLEYPIVFYVGLEEKISPNYNKSAGASKEEMHEIIEEEKRLFYVGVTRARYRLYLTAAKERKWYGRTRKFKPSRFLKVVPWKTKERKPFFKTLMDFLIEKQT